MSNQERSAAANDLSGRAGQIDPNIGGIDTKVSVSLTQRDEIFLLLGTMKV